MTIQCAHNGHCPLLTGSSCETVASFETASVRLNKATTTGVFWVFLNTPKFQAKV